MIDPGTGALISAGINVAGGLLGGSKFKSWHGRENIRNQQIAASVMPAEVRKGAIAGGFNPLTVLSNGGLQTPSWGGSVTSAPLASIQMIAGGLSSIADEFTGVASQRRAQEQLSTDLLKLQIEQAKAVPAAARQGLGGPASVGSQSRQNPADPKVVNDGTRTSVTLFGENVSPNLGFSDGTAWTDRYGEPGEWLSAPLTIGADIGTSLRKLVGRTDNASDTWRKFWERTPDDYVINE